MEANDWMTRKQVADLLGYSPKTLANWAGEDPPKGPPSIRVGGGRCRYRYADVIDWREQQYAQV
ncbi:helix-turn-helix transcriptional regulator [Nocardia grenadensis]|uniref:helix-turn-helix transcriptional regulator n=1 Tax=Nocardia grenadensis TaxID=931537 RepID=UPI003D713E93